MDVKRDGNNLEVMLDGPIGETCPLFTYVIKGVTRLIIDMKDVTFINSIGVKYWIMWTVKIPRDCSVELTNIPFVIASQASMVVGFVSSAMKIQSVRAPYICEGCSNEEVRLLKRGVDFEYAVPGRPAQINVGVVKCSKCGQDKLEPDFITGKTFKFLD